MGFSVDRRQPVIWLIVAVAVLLIAVITLSAALISHDNDSPGKSFGSAEADCSSVTGTSNIAELRRIVPDASSYAVTSEKIVDEKSAKLRCEVRADDQVAVRFLVKETAGDRDDWEKYITRNEIEWSPDRHRVDRYGGGFSDTHAAALFLPCPGRKAAMGANEGLSLTVTTPSGSDHEKDLLRLAERTADRAVELVGCEK
ncbi:hypothetical protein [Streptomyces sp. AA1529]|uniref:hypothetical protein n=1 Tax=Streptomyces sp. AA1529 TaxID=1203257 RepID=UPI000362DB89|nr:hypothetical protein [Streptomyces sp. AA1529]